MSATTANKPMITDIFVQGGQRGWGIATRSILPYMVMAFVLIQAFKVSGLLEYIGILFEPVMNLFGLPGESAMILMAGWMSIGGGVGVGVALFEQGIVNGLDLSVIAPAIFIMGGQLGYMGRCLGTIGIQGKMLFTIMAIPPVIALISLVVMRAIVSGMGL